nr:hypothetical protein [Candidatus Sigynarchaeota archaeon]
MTVMMIRVKKKGNSIIADLKRLGFIQVNVISYCHDSAMAVVHGELRAKDSSDLIVTNLKDAKPIIKMLKNAGMYLSHHEAENPASGNFIEIERPKCKKVR